MCRPNGDQDPQPEGQNSNKYLMSMKSVARVTERLDVPSAGASPGRDLLFSWGGLLRMEEMEQAALFRLLILDIDDDDTRVAPGERL